MPTNKLSNGEPSEGIAPPTAFTPILPPTPILPLDDVINRVGFGLWTVAYFSLATFIPMSMLVNLLVAEFTAAEVAFTCSSTTESHFGASMESLLDDIHVINAGMAEGPDINHHLSKECFLPGINDSTAPSNMPCSTFTYDNSTFETTITTEFELVCSREWHRSLFQMMFTLGCLAGAPVGGVVADMFGRQKAIWWGCACLVVLTVILTAVPVLWVLLAVRFLLGFFTDIVFIASVTVGMEVCPSSYRHAFGTVESLPYAIMLPVLAAIAYLSRHWRPIQLWASLPLFLAFIIACPLILDESPRWLVLRGRLAEAEKVLRRAARLNRTSDNLPHDLLQLLAKTYKEQSKARSGEEPSLKANLWSLVAKREMRNITLALTVLWFFEGSLYISLPLNASSYQSPFLYLALLGLMEVPGTLVVTPLGGRWGRKRVGFICAVITAVLMVVMAVMTACKVDIEWLQVALAVVAYITLVGVSQMTLLLTTELYPTTVRSLGSSIGFFMNNLGYCVPPLLEIILPSDQPEVALVIYSVMAVVSAGLLLLLPETNGRPLFETVEEHVDRQRGDKEQRQPLAL